MDCSLTGSSVHGIFQARILEWVAISFSRGSSRPRDQTQVSRIVGSHFTAWATREVQVRSNSVTSWTATCQASLSFTVSQSLLKLISIGSVMPSTLCHPFSCPQSFSVQSFPMSQLFTSGGQSFGASASVLPVNIQDWFHLGLTGLISLLSKGFFRVFSKASIRKHQFFSSQPSLWSSSHIHTQLLEKP